MRKYYKYIAIFTVVFLFNCEVDDSTKSDLSNFVGFESGPGNLAIEKDLTSTLEILVAASEVSGSDRTYSILVDDSSTLAAAYSVPSTVTIPANSILGTLAVSITEDDMLSFTPQSLVLNFEDEAGVDFGDSFSVNITELCEGTQALLTLEFDSYAEEAYWEMYDLSGTPTVIYSGGQGGAYTAFDNDSLSFPFCLEPGLYGIVVYDNYGDGGTTYTLTSDGATLASGVTPDAGGGYPTTTNSSSQFTID